MKAEAGEGQEGGRKEGRKEKKKGAWKERQKGRKGKGKLYFKV